MQGLPSLEREQSTQGVTQLVVGIDCIFWR